MRDPCDFDTIISHILRFEGGYVNHPDDPGGATNFGITQKVWEAWWILRHPQQTLKTIKDMTEEEAKEIYRAQYWNVIKGDALPCYVAFAVMDFAVHSGTAVAVKALQRVLGVQADGIMGLVTLGSVPHAKDQAIHIAFAVVDQREEYIRALTAFRIFGRGWMNRLNRVREILSEWESGEHKDTEISEHITPRAKGRSRLLANGGKKDVFAGFIAALCMAIEEVLDVLSVFPGLGMGITRWLLFIVVISVILWFIVKRSRHGEE